jgi:hypothetical protein
MVERHGENLSVRRQCELLNLARSDVYRPALVTRIDDLTLMRRIDELHLKWPFYGSRRMAFELNQADTASTASASKIDARDGDRGADPAPGHQQGRARPQDPSLSAAA